MSALISYKEALAVIEALPLAQGHSGGIPVPLAACMGGTLATDLTAPIPSPPFTNAAMDGIAIKHQDLVLGSFEPLGVMLAQSTKGCPHIPYKPQGCVRIMTGAPLPPWADTVIPVEKTSVTPSGHISVTAPLGMGAHIRRLGDDLPQGVPLLKKGVLLRAEDLMVAAAFGFETLPIERHVNVRLLTTGSELVEPGSPLEPGMIYNASKYFLWGAASNLGLRGVTHDTLPDDEALASQYVERVTKKDSPTLIISTGAVSAGEMDFIPRLAASLNFEPLFHKVAIRPGKPIFLGRRGATLWLGLPGNPISTAVGWHFFARPILHRMGLVPPLEKRSFILRNQVITPEGLRCFYRAEVSEDQRSVWVSRLQGSAHFASTLTMGAYIEFSEEKSTWPANSTVHGILTHEPRRSMDPHESQRHCNEDVFS